MVSQHEGSDVADPAIISAAQKLEHYEMASFQCLREWAKLLHNRHATNLLDETLDEGRAADRQLSYLAQRTNGSSHGKTEWGEEPLAVSDDEKKL
jgi:ferritin-like metal-binding protein YciE